MYALFKKLLKHIYSFPCPACKENASTNNINALCCDCMDSIDTIYPPLCAGCGGPHDGFLELCGKCLKADERPWDKALAVFNMRGFGKKIIHSYKYSKRVELSRPLGVMAANRLKESGIEPDFIVPIPLHWSRYFMRGYNQSELVGKVISEQTGIPMKKFLVRSKRTKQQAKLDRKQREKNLMGAFSVKKNEFLKKRTILLIDDVITTGSTLTAATKVLLDEGADKVDILVLARR